MELIVGNTRVLLVRTSTVVRPTKVVVAVGRVRVPVFVIEVITGVPEKVLTPAMVWIDVKSTKVDGFGICDTRASVPVAVGRVNIPVLLISVNEGAVVNVLYPVMVWSVSNVTPIFPTSSVVTSRPLRGGRVKTFDPEYITSVLMP